MKMVTMHDEYGEHIATSDGNTYWYNDGAKATSIGSAKDVKAWMKKNGFWPSVYSVSDHGNVVELVWHKGDFHDADYVKHERNRKARIARQGRDDVMRSCGLVKVRGAVSGKTYWE